MVTFLPKSDSREKIIHIAAGATILTGLISAMLLRLLLPVSLLFYTLVIYVTWKLVLMLAKRLNISRPMLPGLWLLVLGLMMLSISVPALLIISPMETDMGYGFIIFITVVVPGAFVASAGLIVLLIGMGIRTLKKRKALLTKEYNSKETGDESFIAEK